MSTNYPKGMHMNISSNSDFNIMFARDCSQIRCLHLAGFIWSHVLFMYKEC